MTERTPLIAGNWKMNLDHLQAIALIQKLAWTLNEKNHDFKDVEVCVIPPFTSLRSAQTLIEAEKFELSLGAQDISKHASGAYTGEISGAMLSKLAVKYVLVGHSERRQYHNEDDSLVGVVVAGGEYILSPDEVRLFGDGDLESGHRALDDFVQAQRQKHIKTLRKLPPPARD